MTHISGCQVQFSVTYIYRHGVDRGKIHPSFEFNFQRSQLMRLGIVILINRAGYNVQSGCSLLRGVNTKAPMG